MGNTNLKEASIRSFEPNISNMSFILNDDSVLIPFISNTINKVFIDSLNKSTNLNLYNSISIENNNSYLKQQIKFSQMLGDLLDKNIESNMENTYSSEEEVLYHNLFNINKYQIGQNKNNLNEFENNDSSFNISLENISSIHGSGKSSRNETQEELSQISVNLFKPNLNSNNNKQLKIVKIGKKEDFRNTLSKEKNTPYIRPESQNSSSNNKPMNLSVQENINTKNRNKKKINISKPFQKKSNSPKQKIIKNPLILINSHPRKIRSNDKNNKYRNNIMKEKISSPQKNINSPINSLKDNIIKYFNLPKNLSQSPNQSESTNYSNNQSLIKPNKINFDNSNNNSYVKIMKMKKKWIEKRKTNLTTDHLNNISILKNKERTYDTYSRDNSFEKYDRRIHLKKINPIRKQSISPPKKESNRLKDKYNLNLSSYSPKIKNENIKSLRSKTPKSKQSKSKSKTKKKKRMVFQLNLADEMEDIKDEKINNLNTKNLENSSDEKLNNSENHKIEEKTNINSSHLINGSFNISQDEIDNDKINKDSPFLLNSDLSENSNFTSKFNSNLQNNQISYTVQNYTSFGNYNIITDNSENTKNSNNPELYKNSLKLKKLQEFKMKQEGRNSKLYGNNRESNFSFKNSNYSERVSNPINPFGNDNKFQSNTLKALYNNYHQKNDSINEDLGIIKEENPFEKTPSINQDNFSFNNKTLNDDNNIMTITHYTIKDESDTNFYKNKDNNN